MSTKIEQNGMTKADRDEYLKATQGIAEIPEDAEITSTGDMLAKFANAHTGFRYYLLDSGRSMEATQQQFEAYYKPDGWCISKGTSHSNVHPPRAGLYSMVIHISDENYEKRVWRKRLAMNKLNNERYGINEVAGSTLKKDETFLHQGKDINAAITM